MRYKKIIALIHTKKMYKNKRGMPLKRRGRLTIEIKG